MKRERGREGGREDLEVAVNGGDAGLEHGQGEDLGDDQAERAKHANPPVLELRLAQPAEVKVVGEAHLHHGWGAGQGGKRSAVAKWALSPPLDPTP